MAPTPADAYPADHPSLVPIRRTGKDTMIDTPAPLALDGGVPLRSAPWPEPPAVTPAGGTEPARALEAAIAAQLDLPATAVVAYADPGEAYAAAMGRPDGERDEAVIPALCAAQAADAARRGGWCVVPGEVEADTGTVAIRGLARAAGPETALAVVVHTFGHPATMSELVRIARDRDLTVVEEITGALGASFRREPVGRLGHRAVMTTGAGDPVTRGAYVIAPDSDQADALRSTRTAAPNEDDARVALAQVRGLDEELEHRRHLAWELTFALRGMKGIAPMAHGRWVQHAYVRYVVRVRGAVWKRSIEDTVAALRAEGIPAEVACGPSLHTDPEVRAGLPDDPRVSDDVFAAASRLPHELIAIPLHSGLTSKDMEQVAEALRKVEAHSA